MKQVEIKRRQSELLSCIIGLINILIFGNKLGNNGIAFLSIAFVSFSLIRMMVSGSVAEPLGKMLRVRNAKGQRKNAACIRRRVLILQGCLGAVTGILFAIFAAGIAQRVFQVQYCTFIIMLLAPAIFLRTLSAVLVGCFQGEGTELPATIVAPLRQLMLLGFGMLLVNILGKYGEKVSALLGDTAYTAMYGGVGIAIAINLTELLILIFLGVIMLGSRRSGLREDKEGMKQTDSLLSTVRILYGAMWIPMLLQVLELLPLWLGALFYRKSQTAVGVFADNFGMLVGKYLVLCGILVLLLCIVLLSTRAKIVTAFRKEDYRSARNHFQKGLEFAVVQGLFVTAFVAVTAEQLAGVMNGANSSLLAEMFRYGSALILFASLFFYFSDILLRLGRKTHLLGVVCLLDIMFMILTSILLNTGKVGIMSLIYGALVAMGVGCLVLGWFCLSLLRTGIDWLHTLAIPAGGACAAGLVCMLLGKLLTPHLGNVVTLIVGFVIATIIYEGVLLFFKKK